MVEVRRRSRSMENDPRSTTKRHGWALPPEGASDAAWAISITGSSVSGSAGDDGGSAHGVRSTAGGALKVPTMASRSTRTRPEGSGSPRPRRRTAAATAAPPRVTSPASWGQVDSVRPISASEAAPRAEVWPASTMSSTYGIFWGSGSDASMAAVTPGSRLWRIGRSGSRSKRSTSSRPRSLVSITTGTRCRRATSRRSIFMSIESHSSTRMSRPATNSSMLSSLIPSGSTRSGR